MQTIRMTFAIAVVGFAVLAGARAPAEAAPLSASPLASMSQQVADQADGSALQKVHYRKGHCWRHGRAHSYCRNWRWRCAKRWGWHTPRYRQCLRRHGC